MKRVLNLYAGIGGNRKLWEDVEVTAVELDPQIASIYQDFFPDDEVIVTDAHQYLLEHIREDWDLIRASPPCPTHSKINKCFTHGNAKNPLRYPDMMLYQEIIILQHYAPQKYCVENVITYYDPLIKPQELGGHYYWSNFIIPPAPNTARNREHYGGIEALQKLKGFDLTDYTGVDKIKTLRNCVEPLDGRHIFNMAFRSQQKTLFDEGSD